MIKNKVTPHVIPGETFRMTYLACLIFTPLTVCLASTPANLFEGFWSNEWGSVCITKCHENRCHIDISTNNDVYMCELDGTLSIRKDNRSAVFEVQDFDTGTNDNKHYVPIEVSLAKQTLTIDIPEESYSAARGYCGAKAFFEGDYTMNKSHNME